VTHARAWTFSTTGGPDVLELIDQQLPEPGPGEALVRLRAIGVNRSDLMHLAGRYIAPPPTPSHLGQEAVGEVIALGPPGEPPVGDWPLEVGRKVGLMVGRVDYANMGTYRTVGIYPQRALLPHPETFSDSETAAWWLASLTALGGLRVGALREGHRALVTAASSGVGVMALQIARALGAETIASTTSPDKLDVLRQLADHVVLSDDPAELPPAVAELTGGAGVDLAFDPVGYAYAEALLGCAAADGHVVVYGLLAGEPPPLDLRALILKDLAVHGYTVYRLQRNAAELAAVVGSALQLARGGTVRPIVAAEHPFERAPEALTQLAENRHVGKIVVNLA
jgi:NADPH:quinone reductase-like Zn-dependent oxidoreductase